MNIPDAAIEAAAEALWGDFVEGEGEYPNFSDYAKKEQDYWRHDARVAIEAAMPALEKHFRKELAQELIKSGPVINYELNHDGTEDPVRAAYVEAFRDAARYVRGGTP